MREITIPGFPFRNVRILVVTVGYFGRLSWEWGSEKQDNFIILPPFGKMSLSDRSN